MPTISTTNWVLGVLAALVLLLIIWVALLSVALRNQGRGKKKALEAIKADKDILVVLNNLLAEVDQINKKQNRVTATTNEHQEVLSTVIRHVGVIRYDAFSEVGGSLSFSTALLDDNGDGLVLSAITGRSESRVYAKPISERESTHNLSKEEQMAITQALKGVNA
ncbi:MAG: DUF4446 family protein [Actinomycetia bacterium]|nr:DUF4446 family protein [Actinomycetes bacterium]